MKFRIYYKFYSNLFYSKIYSDEFNLFESIRMSIQPIIFAKKVA